MLIVADEYDNLLSFNTKIQPFGGKNNENLILFTTHVIIKL